MSATLDIDKRIFEIYTSGVKGPRQIMKYLRQGGILTTTKRVRQRLNENIAVKLNGEIVYLSFLHDCKQRHKKGNGTGTKKGLCPICEENPAVSRHHIIPRDHGGSDNSGNIVNLCLQCHDLVEEYADKGVYYSPELQRMLAGQRVMI